MYFMSFLIISLYKHCVQLICIDLVTDNRNISVDGELAGKVGPQWPGAATIFPWLPTCWYDLLGREQEPVATSISQLHACSTVHSV